MEKLTKSRRPVRRELTKINKEVTNLLKKDVLTAEEIKYLRVSYDVIQSTYKSLEAWDEKIKLQHIEDQSSDAVEDAEYDEIENHRRLYLSTLKDLEDYLASAKGDASALEPPCPSTTSEKKKRYHLPEVKLGSYGGKLKGWLSWWSQFKRIHEDDELNPADKFQYLVQSMEVGSVAKQVVDGYPMTAENYEKAVDALKKRFGRPDLQLQVYIRELLSLVITNVTKKQKLPLDELFMELESHLRALTELNLNQADPATWLFPLVESSLSEETLRAWQRSPLSRLDGSDLDPKKTRLDLLMEFIEGEVRCNQQVALAQESFQDVVTEKSVPVRSAGKLRRENSTGFHKPNNDDIPTAASLFTATEKRCTVCEGSHDPERCLKLRQMTRKEQSKVMKERQLCFTCLRRNHRRADCKRRVTCNKCGGKHFDVFCRQSSSVSIPQRSNLKRKVDDSDQTGKRVRFVRSEQDGEMQIVTQSSNQCSERVLLNTLKVKVEVSVGTFKTVRLVGDSGSQRSFAATRLMKEAGSELVENEWLQTIVFGGVSTVPRCYARKKLTVVGFNGVERSLELLEKNKVTGDIREIPYGPWLSECEAKGKRLNDVGNDWSEAEILIGNDYWGAIRTGRIVKLNCGLTAEETVFGWTLGGPAVSESIMASTLSMERVAAQDIERLWSLESLGIRDSAESKTLQEDEEEAVRLFRETVTRRENGRYIVALPWKVSSSDLPTNRRVAAMRLKSTTHKLVQTGKLKSYHEVFKNWESEGLIVKVHKDEDDGHYIPHRAVFKNSLTTPVRPVFDASCRTGRNPSLNDCLFKGPNLIELIPSMLLRFGESRIGVSADIRKAFQMLEVAEGDRKYQRFLWWETPECQKMIVYEHNRVVFGITSSPFLLGATIKLHLENCKNYEGATDLTNGFYVDNLVASVNSVTEYEKLKVTATKIMDLAKMELREWSRSSITRKEQTNSETLEMSILGVKWNREDDWLSCKINDFGFQGDVTKRMMLSVVAQVFDPLGYVAPAMLVPKMMVQETWSLKYGWDVPVPGEVAKRFMTWTSQLPVLRNVKVKRWNKVDDIKEYEVHIFCDSSKDGMAAVAFMKTWNNKDVKLQFLMSKSRLCPLKKITIPRSELVSCVIGVRIAKLVSEALGISTDRFRYWSDSATALCWIRRQGDWSVFVRNRVKEILASSEPSQWSHVPGTLNPADLPSRGCTPKILVESGWWEGPTWLLRQAEIGDVFPEVETANEDEVQAEVLKTKKVITSTCSTKIPRFSNYRSNVAVWGWVHRFLHNCRNKNRITDSKLTIDELRHGETALIREMQNEAFGQDCQRIGKMHVVRDPDGLLRVKTRLANREDTHDFIYPIVLPRTHPLVDMLVADLHKYHGHGGLQFLLSKILQESRTEGDWTVCKVPASCSKAVGSGTSPLPKKRVEGNEVFGTTGVDLAGPLFLKNGEKVWIVVFTCALYRAVYLDLVRSLSTEDFIMALERFVAQYARPNTIFSDNGTNFVGAANLFSSVDWESVERESGVKQIQWTFNPPTAAWWGGFWERIIRMIKDLLKRMLGKARLTYDMLRTCIHGVTATINDRPLTVVTEDASDLITITPAMFLRPGAWGHFPDVETSDGLRGAYKKMKDIQRALQERFRKEYLGLLVTRGGKDRQDSIAVGDVVLVGSDNRKRFEWPLGIVTELFPGSDKKVRTVRVRTSTGSFVRPLQRLYPLEVSSNRDENVVREAMKKTRSGRIVKSPSRYGQWMCFVSSSM